MDFHEDLSYMSPALQVLVKGKILKCLSEVNSICGDSWNYVFIQY